jgi:hypothetical protein
MVMVMVMVMVMLQLRHLNDDDVLVHSSFAARLLFGFLPYLLPFSLYSTSE